MSGIIIVFYTLIILLDIAVGIFNFTINLPILGIIWFIQAGAWLYVEIVICASIKDMKNEESLN